MRRLKKIGYAGRRVPSLLWCCVVHPTRASALVLVCLLLSPVAFAYPEFQAYSQKHSGRYVDCSMCHVNPQGPEGTQPGQIGSLSPKALQQLNRARAAFKPGANADNPILNDFGDHIINTLGRTKFIQLRRHPEKLAAALGMKSDLDGDGIPDAREYLDGTLPLDPDSGDPWLLFINNLKRYWFHVVMIILATLFGLYGLNNLGHWLSRTAETALEERGTVEETGDGTNEPDAGGPHSIETGTGRSQSRRNTA